MGNPKYGYPLIYDEEIEFLRTDQQELSHERLENDYRCMLRKWLPYAIEKNQYRLTSEHLHEAS